MSMPAGKVCFAQNYAGILLDAFAILLCSKLCVTCRCVLGACVCMGVRACMREYMCMHACVCMWVCVCMRACMCVCMRACVCVCMRACVRMCVCVSKVLTWITH